MPYDYLPEYEKLERMHRELFKLASEVCRTRQSVIASLSGAEPYIAALDALRDYLKPPARFQVTAYPERPGVVPESPFNWHCQKAIARVMGWVPRLDLACREAITRASRLGIPFEVTENQGAELKALGFKVEKC